MTQSLLALSADFVKRYARDLYHCSSCNYCVDAVWPERGINHVCPTMQQHSRAPGYSGRGYIEAARALLEEHALDADVLAERVYTCTSCGNCERACPIGLRPAAIAHGLRQELVRAGSVPPDVAAARERILEQANPFGVARVRRADWHADYAFVAAAEYRYFPGCAAAVALPDEARAAVALMRQAGCAPALADTSDQCCGAPLAELGFGREGDAWRAAIRRRLAGAAAMRCVVSGYECLHQLNAAGDVDLISLPAWLLAARASGRIELKLKPGLLRPLVVHAVESCQLKSRPDRASHDDEAAWRALIDALGIECRPTAYPSAHALCCGASGGMPSTRPELAARMATARLPGAGMVVTLDPRCAAHLAAVEPGREVLGVAQFIERYCELIPRAA